eukprot:scaffold1060_cov385-Pavlova_lutheri.AAC.18
MKKQAWCTRILSDVGVTTFGPLVKIFEYWDGLEFALFLWIKGHSKIVYKRIELTTRNERCNYVQLTTQNLMRCSIPSLGSLGSGEHGFGDGRAYVPKPFFGISSSKGTPLNFLRTCRHSILAMVARGHIC